MKITELIKELQSTLAEHGDLDVELAYEFDDEETFELVNDIMISEFTTETGETVTTFVVCTDSIN